MLRVWWIGASPERLAGQHRNGLVPVQVIIRRWLLSFWSTWPTLLTTIPPKLWATKIMGRVSVCATLYQWRPPWKPVTVIPLLASSPSINRWPSPVRDRINIENWSENYYGCWHHSPNWVSLHFRCAAEESHVASWPRPLSRSSHDARWDHARLQYYNRSMSDFCMQRSLDATYSSTGSTPSAKVVSPDGNGLDLDEEAFVGGVVICWKPDI